MNELVPYELISSSDTWISLSAAIMVTIIFCKRYCCADDVAYSLNASIESNPYTDFLFVSKSDMP